MPTIAQISKCDCKECKHEYIGQCLDAGCQCCGVTTYHHHDPDTDPAVAEWKDKVIADTQKLV